MSPANKKPKKNPKKTNQAEDNNSLTPDELNISEEKSLSANGQPTDLPVSNGDQEKPDNGLSENQEPLKSNKSSNQDTKLLGVEPENDLESDLNQEDQNNKIRSDRKPVEQDFLDDLRSIPPQEVDDFTNLRAEAMRAETLQPKYDEKPTIPREAFHPDSPEADYLEELNKKNKTVPLDDASTEDFIKSVTNSLSNDPFIKMKETKPENEIDYSQVPEPEDADYLAEIESEIENASQATNPFETSPADSSQDDFLTRLKEIFPEDYSHEAITRPLEDFDEFGESPASLSSESWQEVIKATEENASPLSSDFLLEQPSKEQLEDELFSQDWQALPIDRTPIYGETREDGSALESPIQHEDDHDLDEVSGEPKESVDNLRRTFIEEFEQSPWPEEELIPEKEEGWLSQKWHAFSHWIQSLNGAEKALLIMSSIITLAVIVAIGLVLIRWQGRNSTNGTPPESIASVDPNLVYPTGLQLPGGWFFFLQRGQLQNEKWDPQTAEWLQTSTVRRVIAIPWSRQAEAVVQTLNEGDEIRVFMNNNDIMNYYVDKVDQVERDNVEILSSNEPSLAVILFKEDNSNRWVILAIP